MMSFALQQSFPAMSVIWQATQQGKKSIKLAYMKHPRAKVTWQTFQRIHHA